MWKHRVTEYLESCPPRGHSSLVSRSSRWLPSSLSWINARDGPNEEKELLPKPAAITSCVPLPPENSDNLHSRLDSGWILF